MENNLFIFSFGRLVDLCGCKVDYGFRYDENDWILLFGNGMKCSIVLIIFFDFFYENINSNRVYTDRPFLVKKLV